MNKPGCIPCYAFVVVRECYHRLSFLYAWHTGYGIGQPSTAPIIIATPPDAKLGRSAMVVCASGEASVFSISLWLGKYSSSHSV